MKVAGQIKISSNILQNATKKKPTIESQERDQQKIECISHLVPEKKNKKREYHPVKLKESVTNLHKST